MKSIIMHNYYILINTFLKEKSMPLLSHLGLFLEIGSYISQGGLELTTELRMSLILLPECWSYRQETAYPIRMVLGFEIKSSGMLGRQDLPTDSHSHPKLIRL